MRRGNSWKLSPVFDVTPATSKADFATPIDEALPDTVETLFEVCELFSLERGEALAQFAEVVDAVAHWRHLAREHGIPASEDAAVAHAFGG